MQVVVSKDKKKSRFFHLSQSLKKLGKYVGRRNKQSIARAVVENVALRKEVVTQISRLALKEIKLICSDTHDSILRMKSKIALEKFTWERVWLELEQYLPLLVSIFLQFVPQSKRENLSTRRVLCVCISILLKLHCHKINLVQAIISLLLKCGHATTQVRHFITRLQYSQRDVLL